jgi:Protein of unknown function (DUF5674)
MIHLLSTRATPQQMEQMREEWDFLIKVAVDVQRGLLAGGGNAHSDCEEVLMEDGSHRDDVWGAGLMIYEQRVTFTSVINYRASQGMFTDEVTDPALRERIAAIVISFLGGL